MNPQTDKRHIKVPQDRLLCPTYIDNKKNRFSNIFIFSVLHDETSLKSYKYTCACQAIMFLSAIVNEIVHVYALVTSIYMYIFCTILDFHELRSYLKLTCLRQSIMCCGLETVSNKYHHLQNIQSCSFLQFSISSNSKHVHFN